MERIHRASIEAQIIETEIELIKYASSEMGLFYQSLWRSIKTEKISFEKLMVFLELIDLELTIKPKKEKLPH
jgi:hypothetical protein